MSAFTANASEAASKVTQSRLALRMRRDMTRAMQDSDHWVVHFDYCDSKGEKSHRVVSPIRFVGADRMLGLCLSREEPRQFYLSRCENVAILPAEDVLMPVPLMKQS
ncbi:MAG: hypothetical protein R3C03_07360 [Pirellulaceae bacterium]